MSQSDEALVEIARIVRDRFEDGGGCVDGPDWDWDVDECAKVADDVARAILPIITAREASAYEEGRRDGIEEGWREGYCAGAYRTETFPLSGNEINAAWAARQERRALAEKQG